jgi:hypothetical protein
VQREIRILVAEQMAGPHVVADVVDSRPALGQPRLDVERFGHRSADPSSAAAVGLDVTISAGAQFGGDLRGGARPLVQPLHDIVDGQAHGVAVSGVSPPRKRPVEPQSSQMIPNGGVDDVRGGVVLAGGVEHRRNIDTRAVRFSHTGYDADETAPVP